MTLPDNADQIRRHYESVGEAGEVVARIVASLDEMDGPMTSERLAGFDHFHVRGLAATIELIDLLEISPNAQVLDAGSGLGGPSRYVAETRGCSVTGVDLAPSYVAISRLLADRAGLSAWLDYQVGNLLELPFDDATFDIVFTQHVVMNIADRVGAYREIRRVLKPGGRFGFYDVLAVDGGPAAIYPTPWSDTAERSTVLTPAQTRAAYAAANLRLEVWRDPTADAVAWFDTPRPTGAAGLSLVSVLGPRFPAMAMTLARNLREGRLQLAMGVCRAV